MPTIRPAKEKKLISAYVTEDFYDEVRAAVLETPDETISSWVRRAVRGQLEADRRNGPPR